MLEGREEEDESEKDSATCLFRRSSVLYSLVYIIIYGNVATEIV